MAVVVLENRGRNAVSWAGYFLLRLHMYNGFIPEHRNNLDRLTDYMLDFIFQKITKKEHINE